MTALSLQILTILAPGIILALIGLIWFHRGPAFPVDFVTTLVLNIGMPALLFHTLANSSVSIGELGVMAAATLVLHIVFTAIAIVLLKFAGKDWRLCIALVVGNTGNLGLPVCLLAFGEDGLAFAMTYFAVQCVLLFSFGDAISSGNASVMRLLRSPILHAIWIGVVVRILGWSVPAFIVETTQLLGQLVIPVMLITLGVSLAGMRSSQLPSNLLWSAVRTGLAVLIAVGIAALFQLDGVARGVLIIETVVPVAVFNYLLAIRDGRDSSEVSGLILVTHVASIAYLPIVLAMLLR